jgi:hypothetical protein
MSTILNFSGNESRLRAVYFPSIELTSPYECGLVSCFTYNSSPNVDKTNNLFHIGKEIIEIPEGSYEIDDIADYITNKLKQTTTSPKVTIHANTNTLKIQIKGSQIIYFNKNRSIGALLGFSKREIQANITFESDLPVNINKINSIRIECNITTGSYMNNKPVHTIHEFSPDVLPGYKINEVLKNIIYLPLNTNSISSVTLELVDQDGNLIDFRGETMTIRLHLRPST